MYCTELFDHAFLVFTVHPTIPLLLILNYEIFY